MLQPVGRAILAGVIVFHAVAVCRAQGPTAGAHPSALQLSQPTAVTLVSEPPRLEEFLASPVSPAGMRLTRIDGFIQRLPDDAQPASEATTTYLGHDGAALYVVFVAADRDPRKLRTQLRRRDTTAEDEDSVGVLIDTFQDQRRAYQFWCSPLGVQNDAIFSEDTGQTDLSFDAVWQARAAVTPSGYVVWIRIPFKSLRFRAATNETWGVLLYRRIGRRAEEAWWPAVTTRVRGRLNQAARLTLNAGSPGRNIEAVPYVSSRAYRLLDRTSVGGAATSLPFTDGVDASAGVDLKLVMKDSVVLDVALNPDFSQVESDEPQSVVNQRFEVFYPEKRPFFIENAAFFDVPSTARLLFTRRIVDPQSGIRLTGKVGRQSIGVLFTDDEAPGRIASIGSPLRGRRAVVGAARYSRDLPRQSSIGGTYTERRLMQSYNRVVAFDATAKWSAAWSASVLGARSASRDLNDVAASGTNLQATVRRDSRHLNMFLVWIDRSPEFRADVGFVRRTDIREIDTGVSYRFWPAGRWLRDIWPGVNVYQIWDTRGTRVLNEVNPTVTVSFRHPTTLVFAHRLSTEVLRPKDFAILAANRTYAQNWLTGTLTSSLATMTVKANVEVGRRINYLPVPGTGPTLASFVRGEGGLSFRPRRTGLVMDNIYIADRYLAEHGGAEAFTAQVIRSKVSWQITTRWAVRFIADYARTTVDPAYSSARAKRALNGDLLLSFTAQPGTALYVGYNHNRRDLSELFGEPWKGTVINDGRQLFTKVSYRLPF